MVFQGFFVLRKGEIHGNRYKQAWREFKEKTVQKLPDEIATMQFVNTKAMANELGQLVLSGKKTATSSLIGYHDYYGVPVSQIGDCYFLLDWQGSIIGVLEVTKTATVPFSQISLDFALAEGDGSYDNWFNIHYEYYEKQLESMDRPLTDETLLHCEWFQLIG